MRRIFVSFLILVMLVFGSVFGYKYWLLNQDWREEYAYAKGVDAFIHTFPYFLNSALRYKWSHSSEEINRGPSEAINQFWHAPNVSHPRTYQDGGMPTRDALYSVAWVWVGDEPTVIELPAFKNDRYYSVQIAGFDSDNFAYITRRERGEGNGQFVITPPKWEGTLPNHLEFIAQAPTSWIFIILRVGLDPDDVQDLNEAKLLQMSANITSLSGEQLSNEYPNLAILGELGENFLQQDMADFLKQVIRQDPLLYWRVVNQAMTVNGLSPQDHKRLSDWADIGVGPGLNIDDFDESIRSGLSRSVLNSIMIMRDYVKESYGSKIVNGWSYPISSTGRSGHAGHYLNRAALQSMTGVVAHDSEEAMYILVNRDSEGKPINGKHQYQVTFASGQLPDVSEFWSITAYDNTGNLVVNDYERYSLNEAIVPLDYSEDGQLVLKFGGSEDEDSANWLPLPKKDMTLVFRAYGPGPDIVSQKWAPPQVVRLQ